MTKESDLDEIGGGVRENFIGSERRKGREKQREGGKQVKERARNRDRKREGIPGRQENTACYKNSEIKIRE